MVSLRIPILLAAVFVVGSVGGFVGARMGSDHNLAMFAAPGLIQIGTLTGGDGIADLVAAIKPAVVNIDTVSHKPSDEAADPYRFLFSDQAPPAASDETLKGVGSGFFVRSDGLLVTNFHVVQGADKLTVTTSDGTKYKGKVVGTDPATDLALVKVPAKAAPCLKMAEGKDLRVGQYVVAVGSPLGLEQTVTAGILSATDRDLDLNAHVSFLQTDAPINPGNSGGPLLNLRGEVIGVNTALASDGRGIGFAVPVDILRQILPELVAHGRIDHSWLGVDVMDLPDSTNGMFSMDNGIMIAKVRKRSPAARAGLHKRDVLVAMNGVTLDDPSTFIRTISKLPVGTPVELAVVRHGQQKTIRVVLGKTPPSLVDDAQDPDN